MLPAAPFQDRPGEATRVVFYDPKVDPGWIDEPEAIAETLTVRGGYRVLDERALDEWLAVRTRGDADATVLFNLHGPAIGRDDRLLAFMRSGGRLVWAGFPPTFLGLSFRNIPEYDAAPAETTEEGVRWGLRPGRRGGHYGVTPAANAGTVLVRRGDDAVFFFLNLNSDKPSSGFLKLHHGMGADWSVLSEALRVAGSGLGPTPDTERLMLLSEEPAPAAPASPTGGSYVRSGEFRIAREKALEKLQAFQLADPSLFLLPLARAAAAAGARVLRVGAGLARITVEHDGKPLPAERVADPFGALFDRRDDRAAIETATAVLAVLRGRPSWVDLESGGKLARIRSATDFRLGGSDRSNRVTVQWTVGQLDFFRAWALRRKALRELRDACGTGRLRVIINGAERPPAEPPAEAPPDKAFDKGGVRGRIYGGPTGTFGSRLALHYLGVRCAESKAYTDPRALAGWLDCDDLTLPVSQTGVVRDEKFDAALASVREPGLELVAETAAEWALFFPSAARLVFEGQEATWRRHNSYRHRRHPADLSPTYHIPLGEDPLLARAAQWAWFMRWNAEQLPDTPLWMAADGGVLTPRRINELAAERGELRATYHRGGGGADAATTLWLVSSGDIRQAEGLGARPPRFVS
ncbi:MAG: hypothetical protein HY553_01155 [Elusimicrobia bacterium]|nr:hypothetical protein [Elusimicrobiota bacterium]